MKKIVGVGSLIVDIAAYADRLPVDGETALGRTLRLGPGGKGNNQMSAAHRAGAEAIVIGRVGEDALGEIMLKHYQREGMSSRYITVSKKSETGAALIEVDAKTAQNRIVIVKGACDEISAADVRAAEADFASCDLVLTQLETSMDSVLECKRLAAKYNKPFILNPAPFQKIPDGLFDGVDYLTPNETEAEFFTGIPVRDAEDAKKAAAKLRAMGARNAIVTLGRNGALFSSGTSCFVMPGIRVNAIDTTGAGDAFNGAFATAVAEGLDMETALKFANCAGALSTTKEGTAPAMPFRHEIIESLLKSYGVALSR